MREGARDQMRWRWPPDSNVPRSPTTLSTPSRQLRNEVPGAGQFQSGLGIFALEARITQRNVVQNRIVQQQIFLRDVTDTMPPQVYVERVQVVSATRMTPASG